VLDITPTRPHTRHDRLPDRLWVAPGVAGVVVAALLATTLLLPSVSDRGVVIGITAVVAVVLLGALALTWPSSSTRGPLSTAGQLVLHLTPVLLLTTAFPLGRVSQCRSQIRIEAKTTAPRKTVACLS
jgi:hypothetical protein